MYSNGGLHNALKASYGCLRIEWLEQSTKYGYVQWSQGMYKGPTYHVQRSPAQIDGDL